MSQTAFPLDNVTYYAKDMQMFHVGRTTGIFHQEGENDFEVKAPEGGTSEEALRTVTVNPGYAYLFTSSDTKGGIIYGSDETQRFTIDAGSGSIRYDYISIRYNSLDNTCEMTYVKGSNTKPTPVRNSTSYELILAIIEVPAVTGIILQSYITDTRLDSTYCGVVVDSCASVDTDAMAGEFRSFMDDVKEKLSDDVAGKLSERITSLETSEMKYKTGTEDPTTETCPEGYFYFKLEA